MEEIDVTKMEKAIGELKKLYKRKKEELEWCDNDYDAGFVQEEMEQIKVKIKAYRAEIDIQCTTDRSV